MFPSTAWRHPCRCDCIDVGSTLTVIRDEERARNSKQSILYYLSHKPQRSTFEMNYWWILYSYWVQQRWMHAYSIRCFPFPHHIRTCHIQHTIIFWDLFFFRVRFTFVCSWHFCTSITVFDAIGASNDYNQIETKCNRKKIPATITECFGIDVIHLSMIQIGHLRSFHIGSMYGVCVCVNCDTNRNRIMQFLYSEEQKKKLQAKNRMTTIE